MLASRRRVMAALLVAACAPPRMSFAQAPMSRVARLGFLVSETPAGQASRIAALRAGLQQYGYVEGANVIITVRAANGEYDRLPALATELVRLDVDVLVTFGSKATLAARRATATIPIVVPVIGDPGRSGWSTVWPGLAATSPAPRRSVWSSGQNDWSC